MTPTDPIRVNDKEYAFETITPEGQKMINFITGLDAQLDKAAIQMEQLQICREGCHSRLLKELEKYDVEEETGVSEENPTDA